MTDKNNEVKRQSSQRALYGTTTAAFLAAALIGSVFVMPHAAFAGVGVTPTGIDGDASGVLVCDTGASFSVQLVFDAQADPNGFTTGSFSLVSADPNGFQLNGIITDGRITEKSFRIEGIAKGSLCEDNPNADTTMTISGKIGEGVVISTKVVSADPNGHSKSSAAGKLVGTVSINNPQAELIAN